MMFNGAAKNDRVSKKGSQCDLCVGHCNFLPHPLSTIHVGVGLLEDFINS